MAYICASPPFMASPAAVVDLGTAAGVTGTWKLPTTRSGAPASPGWAPQAQSWRVRRQVAGVPDAQFPWPRRFSGQEAGVLYKLPDQCGQAPGDAGEPTASPGSQAGDSGSPSLSQAPLLRVLSTPPSDAQIQVNSPES